MTFPLNATTEPPQALYSIDNSTPSIADVPTVLGNTTTDVGFYRTDSLPLAYHLLVINVTNASGDSPYLLDYVAFDAYDVFPSPSSPPTSTSPDPSLTSTASSLIPTGTTVAVSGSTGTRTISAGISAGVALGGAALLFVVLGSCIWLWRRSARSRRSQHEDAEQSGPLRACMSFYHSYREDANNPRQSMSAYIRGWYLPKRMCSRPALTQISIPPSRSTRTSDQLPRSPRAASASLPKNTC